MLSAKDKQSNDANRLIAERLNSPENKARHAEFEQMAAADDSKRSAAAKIFDPIALLKRASEIHEYKHPTLGVVRFGELMLSDSEIVGKCKTKDDRCAMAVYLMLKKAYPDLPEYTPDTIAGFYRVFPMVEGSSLLQFFLSQPCFLGEKSVSGSKQTKAPTS